MRSSRLVLVLFCGLIPFAVLFSFAFSRTPPAWLPVPVQNWFFDVRLEAAPQVKKISSIVQGSFLDDRIYYDAIGERVEFQSEGLTIVGTLYLPDGEGEYPGIVLLHGSTPEGRKLGFYRVLGKELSNRGYVVLSIDLRGYGESDDPTRFDQYSALDPTEDVIQAINYLTNEVKVVDPTKIYIIGHSAGVKPGIAAGVDDSRISKIVAIGPPRRVQERYGGEESPEFAYFRRRTTRYMRLKEPIPPTVFIQLNRSLNIENYLEYFSKNGHKPIFFIDGMLENKEDQIYLQGIYESMVEPKRYLRLGKADHYANVGSFGALVFFDQKVIQELTKEIDNWFSED